MKKYITALSVIFVACKGPATAQPSDTARQLELCKIDNQNLAAEITRLKSVCNNVIDDSRAAAENVKESLGNCMNSVAANSPAELKSEIESIKGELTSCFQQRDKCIDSRNLEIKK